MLRTEAEIPVFRYRNPSKLDLDPISNCFYFYPDRWEMVTAYWERHGDHCYPAFSIRKVYRDGFVKDQMRTIPKDSFPYHDFDLLS
jgi:hypothetical protein